MGGTLRARAAQLQWRPVEGEIVILDLRSERYLALNPSGARLWPLLIAGTSRRRLVDELVETYRIDDATAVEDVDRLLAELAAADLLEGAGNATTNAR